MKTRVIQDEPDDGRPGAVDAPDPGKLDPPTGGGGDPDHRSEPVVRPARTDPVSPC